MRCADWRRHGSRTGQQGQGEDDETDADDHAEIPGPQPCHPVQTVERRGHPRGAPSLSAVRGGCM